MFLEAPVRKMEPALIKDRASIGTNEANMTTTPTQPDCLLKVLGGTSNRLPGPPGILKST
jgi:hypothetical protein